MEPHVDPRVLDEAWQKKHWAEDCSERDEKSSQISSALRSAGNVLLQCMHDSSVIREVFSHYTKSIAYAQPNSEELALGYSNRSILLYHIKKYDLCLTDINVALKITPFPLRRAKLLIRMINCLKAMKVNVDNSITEEVEQIITKIEDLETKEKLVEMLKKALNLEVDQNFRSFVPEPIPEMDRSKEVPCASNAVEISCDKSFGRSLTVNRSVTPGEILMIEKAYAAFPTLEERYLICSHCLDFTLTGIPCDYCPCIIFCSESCRDSAWKKYHKVECRYLSRLMKQIDTDGLNITFVVHLRCLFTALCENDFKINSIIAENDHAERSPDERTKGFFNGQFLSDKFRCLASLEDRKDQWHTSTCNNIPKSVLIEVFGLKVYTILQSALSDMDHLQSNKDLQAAFKEIIKKIGRIAEIHTFSCQDSARESILTLLDAQGLGEKYIFDEIRDRGLIMATCSALTNHDCTPNACRVFKNGKILIYSLRPLKKNEQVFVTYSKFGIETPRQERQFHLKDNFFFDCKCLSCKHDIFMKSDVYFEKFFKIKEDFRKDLITDSLATMNFSKLVDEKDGEDDYNDSKQKLLEFLKSNISKIYQTKSTTDAIVESFMYGRILMDLYLEIHALALTMEQCC